MRVWSIVAALVLACAAIRPASAMESRPVTSPRATATLVTDTDAVAPGAPLRLGLRLVLAPGWHTYWLNPGDAGVAPTLTLTKIGGAKAGQIQWPAPERMSEGPITTYGYHGDLLLPLTVSGIPAGPLDISAHASWLVCANVCVPEEGTFTLHLPQGTPAPSAQAPLFTRADARMPVPSPWPAHVGADGVLSLTGATLTPARMKAAWFFPAGWGAIDQGAPEVLSVQDGQLTLALKPGSGFSKALPLTGVLALQDPSGQQTAYRIEAALSGAAPTHPVAVPQSSTVPQSAISPSSSSAFPQTTGDAAPFGRALLFAFLGGLLLNLMPCVFPVLAMKALSLARLSGSARGAVRVHALFYTLGVLVAFAALAAALLGLRAAGAAAGWGFQFQSPVFVAAMAWLLFGVGLSLSGAFTLGSSFAGAGQSLAARDGHAGSFFTGLLAVVVATPCTAPFMGVAIAAALSGPVIVALAVFLAMGLGLALPYLLLAAVPQFAGLLPKPGAWMEILKQGLAFPMYGASAWLVWVLSQEAGPGGVLAAGAGLVLIGFAGWALGTAQRSTEPGPMRRFGTAAALAACLAALVVLIGIGQSPPGTEQVSAHDTAVPFNPTRLAALRAEGKPVFVNMTAAWCVTCLVNERVALSPPSVRDAFAAHGVVYMKGDWTRQDPQVTNFLRQYGRNGVPLYVFYPANGKPPSVLPQILTEHTLLDELNRG